MTFRTRLVVAAALAVVVAIFAASIASYFASRDALVGSVDGTLRSTAQDIMADNGHVNESAVNGLGFEYIDPSGTVLAGGGVPIGSADKAVAVGQAGAFFGDITVHHQVYREYVVSAGTVPVVNQAGFEFRTPAAVIVAVPLAAVDSQLTHLKWILCLVAALGVALAGLLAWLVSRMSLGPLDALTKSVEEVAETTDVSRRLDPGGRDEIGRLRRAFNHLLAALERSRESQRQLVLDAGHELRTPLTSLRTNLEVVRRIDELSPTDREVLVDDVLAQLEELTTLVGDLSELARGDQPHRATAHLRLDQVVEDAVAITRTHGRARNIAVVVETEPTWVLGQRERILRAVGNLLDNALKWSPDGSTVEVDCRRGVVTVRDHGPGVDPADVPYVFDRFYRSAGSRALPGSGLGLAIVAQVAEAEGGSVAVGQAPGGGAVFRLVLPTVEPPTATERASEDDGVEGDVLDARPAPGPPARPAAPDTVAAQPTPNGRANADANGAEATRRTVNGQPAGDQTTAGRGRTES